MRRFFLGLAVLIMLPFLFFGGPDYTADPIFPALWNFGHIFFFGCLTILLLSLDRSRLVLKRHPISLLGAWTLLVILVGIGIEWVQYGLDRSPDFHDIWRNVLGAWLGWFGAKGGQALTTLSRPILLGFLVLEILGVLKVGWQDWQVQGQAPMLAPLDSVNELKRWNGSLFFSREHHSSGEACLGLQLGTGRYSGCALRRFPRNWKGYDLLKFDVFNPDKTALKATLRINDKQHHRNGYKYSDRFNATLEIKEGWNHFAIPLTAIASAPKNREMNLEEIHSLELFVRDLPEPRTIFLDNFRLE